MTAIPTSNWIAPLIGMLAVLVWRVRETQRAVTLKKIVIPPLGMTMGLGMFVMPQFRVPLSWALVSFLMGAVVLAWPLLKTSRLEREGCQVMMRRSKAFFGVVLVLAIIRFAARSYLDTVLTLEQTAGLFFLLAYGMILRWRYSLLVAYRAIVAEPCKDASLEMVAN